MRFMRGGIRLFRAFGVSVILDYSWFIFFLLVVWTFGTFYFPRYVRFQAVTSWVLAVSAALLLFASVIFHELSHALVSNRLGNPIRRITLFIFGGVAQMRAEPDDPQTEFLVAVAGPVSSLVLWVVSLLVAIGLAFVGFHSGALLFALTARLNLALALFNLVPGFPLDGGRLLRATLWWKLQSLKRATNVAAKTGEGFAWLLMLFGVLTIYKGESVAAYVAGVWYILIGIFLKNAAEQSYQHVLMEDVLEGIKAGEIMGRTVLSVSENDSLGELIERKFMVHKFPAYPVLRDDGRVVGVVSVENIRDISRDRRRDQTVGSVMERLPVARLPRASTSAMDVLKEMLSSGLEQLPVVDDEGRLAGLITRADIMNMFQIRSDLADAITV